VSAPESGRRSEASTGILLTRCLADVVEIAALRGAAGAPAGFVSDIAPALPAFGRMALRPGGLALAVRPERWLLLSAPAAPGTTAGSWERAVGGAAAVIDLSSALTAWHLAGTAVREMLTRGCRLDLRHEAFAPGRAAATVIAQVSVILTALPAGVLLLTPASTAGYFHEWLASTCRPFGLVTQPDVTVASVASVSAVLT